MQKTQVKEEILGLQGKIPGLLETRVRTPDGCTNGEGRLLKTDQRGKPRPDEEDSGSYDRGAYERQKDWPEEVDLAKKGTTMRTKGRREAKVVVDVKRAIPRFDRRSMNPMGTVT